MSFEFACTFLRETDSTVKVHDYASDEDIWIPLSQVEQMHRPKSGLGYGTIVVTDWIAQQKGLA